jgi:hypothetical protein
MHNFVIAVGRCRRVVEVCDLEVSPPSLEATVIHAAARLLPHYLPSTSGPLRQQPLVQKALQLTTLIVGVGAAEGRSPWVGAGEGKAIDYDRLCGRRCEGLLEGWGHKGARGLGSYSMLLSQGVLVFLLVACM